MTRTPKRPRDPNQLAKLIVDLATMDEDERKAVQRKAAKANPKDSDRQQDRNGSYKPGKRGS